ncbi:hypothetical protein Tco_0271024 [Tanacetum coccineum]
MRGSTMIEIHKDWTSPKSPTRDSSVFGSMLDTNRRFIEGCTKFLDYLRKRRFFIAYCDASEEGLGAVLMQREKIWSTISYRRYHVYGVTDPRVFATHSRSKKANHRQNDDGWSCLSEYDCDIRYHPGKAKSLRRFKQKERETTAKSSSLG